MSNSPSTSLPESFPRQFGTAFDPVPTALPVVELQQQQSLTKVKIIPAGLISLLAKSLGTTRPDWRDHRVGHVAYPNSRVSYIETKMTEEQAREFE